MKSKWVQFRDYMENLFSQAVDVAAPIAQDVLVTTGQAVAAAALNGTAHNSHDMIDVAVKSLKEQAPHLSATVTTALAASIVHDAHAASVQADDAPLNKPPAE